jgi:5-methylcytosine-specific restriction protein A
MPNLIGSLPEILENVETMERYRASQDLGERKFHDGRIKNGKNFVAVNRSGKYIFAPSKFSGYKNNDTGHMKKLSGRDGGTTDNAITRILKNPLTFGDAGYDEVESAFLNYCDVNGISPSKHPQGRRYWLIHESEKTFHLPDEIPAGQDVYEGAKRRVYVNRYERSPKARAACIAHYGCKCLVCQLNFGETYGVLGAGYIHVHHIVPLSTIDGSYKVDPINDLRPVCPNCHAMLHRGSETLSIGDLKKLLMREGGLAPPAFR